MRILITGAGQGLGYWLTFVALQRNHEVYATVHNLQHISKELQACAEIFKNKMHVLEMDVTDEKSVSEVVLCLEEQGAVLDGIVNNAGIIIEDKKTIEQLDLSAMSRSFEVNTIGPMRVIQRMLPYLYNGDSQVIINVSSEAGTIINAFSTNYPYSMSKTALNMFTERLREYLKSKDIFVYAVHPGWMRTNMGGVDAPANPEDIAKGIVDILERKKQIFSKIAFIDSTGRPMPL